ncbi:kinetochore-associated Ndc80 complex subunit nuf2 [Pleurotus pulmonarius]|nr:kinetochore-associated Ndc80 complex subunit nuf2 [Pleurotus pulmonarius]KAF4608804.1 kinetochore-associated Ndc80 complex subunit nuf2 [Pleurotus pulmonarius]
MAKGIFPQMSIPDIIAALSSWGLSVSQEQLLRPSAEFVEGIYYAFLQLVTGLSHDMLREPVQNALSVVGETDLYVSAVTHNALLYHMSRFAQAARVEDFSAKDLCQPERDRTLVLLSAFINFIKFTEQWCNPFIKELRDGSQKLTEERQIVARELVDIQAKVSILKAKIAEDEPRCEQLRKENAALRAKMIATKEMQTAAVQEVEKLKAEKTTLIKRKEALNNEVSTVSESIARTRSRIVQSPERIKRTIIVMGSTAQEDRRTASMLEAKVRDLQTKINALLNIERDLRGCVEQLQIIEKEVGSLEESQKELADLKDHLESKHIERNELTLKQERVEKQLSNAREKLERAQRYTEDKKHTSQKTIDRLQREYDEMAIERRDNDRQVEEYRGEADNLELKMAEHLKASQAELQELLTEYWKLRHETDVYMETLANKLNMTISDT